MKNISSKYFLKIFPLFLFLFILSDCGDDSLSPATDFISGTITFSDANLILNGGYYAVSFYTTPFTSSPVRSDSLAVTTSGGNTTAYYKTKDLSSGFYYIGVTWIRRSDGSIRGVLGTYGCDTVRGCTTHTKLEYPNYAGTGSINFRCWTDTVKRLYP